MQNLLPAKVAPYVKSWLSLIGVIVAAVVTALDSAPKWLTIAGAVLASVGVYLGANTPKANPPAADGTPSATGLPEKGKHEAP